jgi:trk system potassium uptake protein
VPVTWANGGALRAREQLHRFAAVQHVLGLLLMVFSITMLPPMAVSWYYQDDTWSAFGTALWVTLATGAAVWWPVRRDRAELKLRDGFLVVVLFWTVLGVFGAIPLYLAPQPAVTPAQAIFESISGLTTTGATVLIGLDSLPRSILYYRQQLQWLGGMGIIVLAVAVLPMLGVGGMQLYRAETPGPVKDTKLTPRITETARALWLIYLGLTVACALAYWAGGMSLFDAIGHSFSTVAVGGFSTHDGSFAHFNSPLLDSICIVFMILGATNFALHFTAWRAVSPLTYLRDPEFLTLLAVLGGFSLLVCGTLYLTGTYSTAGESALKGVFQVVSLGTTTGFTTAAYGVWPLFLPPLLIFASFIGGCAYSTAGGIKMVRIMLLFKQGMREVVLMIHPNAELPIKLGAKTIPPRIVQAVWGFFSAYMGFFVILMLLMLATGLDIVSAVAAVAACINNLGPGLGDVAGSFARVEEPVLWIGAFAMILGRLELFPILVLLTPAFWRR